MNQFCDEAGAQDPDAPRLLEGGELDIRMADGEG
jgi:hypothetical protein